MKSAIHRTIEATLGLVALALVALLAVPWRQPALPSRTANLGATAPAVLDPSNGSPSLLPIDTVLTLFAGHASPPPIHAAVPAPTKSPTEATWLKYMGFASGADGTSWWYVKDTKTGKIITVSKTQSSGGWSMIESSADRLILKNGEDLYSVSKR